MRKKITMLLASLFLTLGTAWAQVSYTVSANTGTGVNTSGWSNTWTATSNPATLKLLCTASNMQAESDGLLSLYVGKVSPSTYTLQVSGSYRIASYSFAFTKDGEYSENVTLKVNGQDYTPTNEEQTVEVNNVNASSTTFQMAGSNKGIIVSEFVVNVERVLESGYYTIQCNGNNKFANYNGGERIVPMDMGRFKTSVYILTKGENGMYTIQTSDKKYVTYTGTDGDALAIVDAALTNDDNKWWVINQSGETEIFTIVPKQNNIGANTPGWNYSVDFGGANGAVGFYDRSDGNSKWLVKAAPIMTTGTAKIKCAGTYVTLESEATLFTKGNAGNACQFTILAGQEGKYTIQLADGRYVTHKSGTDTGDQIEIKEAGSATDDNKWWVIAPNVTKEKSTGNDVDIIPAHGNSIGRGTPAWNWSVNTNANLGFWGASNDNSMCTIEWTPTTFTYSYSYNGQVKHTEQAQGFVGYPYPAPTLSVFGVVPAPIVGDIVAGDQGKTFDMEYTIDLPFRFSDSYDDIEHWYFMKIRDDGFTYMGYDAEKSYIRANQSNVPTDSKDAYTWGFVGNPFDGFSIVNYATGKTKVLSAPVAPTGNGNADQLARMVEVTNEYTGNLVWNFKAPTHPNPKPGVFYIEHPTATSYAFNRQGYDGANALCYWTGRDTGSAVQVEERGVFNLSDLTNKGIYLLQAERSPLMYSTTAGKTTKLSSGLVDGISANANDINQQFIIFSSKIDGAYYLYSLGANKFVDADLNFTDYPEPVLSFEAYNGTNSALYPWWVKINGKYVIPGNGGTDGNKLHHTAAGDDDDGKRYRIIKVDEDIFIATSVALTIQHADGLIKDASDLSNSKVYTVSTYDRGVWSYNAEEDALWYAASANPETKTEQFAFLTVGGRTYLYSVGAGKFVVKGGENNNYTAYSDVPSQPVEILKATGNKFFPLVVALKDGSNEHHIGISPTYDPPVITFYNDLGDDGNKVDIREAGDLENSAEILATMDAYLTAQTLVPELEALIVRAEKALTYLLEADKEALATAKTNAENVLAGVYDSEMLGGQITALTTALNAAILVDDYAKLKNNYVYSFVTSRGWVGADASSENLIGTANSKVEPAPTPSEDNTMFQWAVYKSSNNHYYMYNIGKGKFMGVQSVNEQPIPFAETPQSLKTTFKNISGGVEYPIMLSPDNVGAVSQNGNAGLFYWAGGWNRTDDAGSNHKVTVVGAITESTLTTIAEAVELYEEICELGDALADADNRLDAALGYYSCTADVQAELAEIEEFKATATDVAEVNAKTARVNELIETFTLNVPQTGKFYRIKNNAGNGYLSSGESGRTQFKADIATDVSSIFGYIDGKLLSYKNGMYLAVNNNKLEYSTIVGSGVAVVFERSRNVGKLQIKFNSNRYLFSNGTGNTDSGDTKAAYIDPAGGSPAGRNANYLFTVEEVTSLPVVVSSVGYATLYAPVALKIPANVTAYVGVHVDNYLDLTDITEVVNDGIIPANTGVILEAKQGTYNFAVADDVAALDKSKNLLTGKYPKSVKNAEKKVYTLQNGVNGVGFYLFNGYKMDGETQVTTYINGFRAWVELPNGSNATALRIRKAGTTEIEETLADGEQEMVIYDLAGRRIEKIVEKGIYIVNGKKVVIR